MTHRLAILLDGGFVTKRLGIRFRRFPTPDEVLAECTRLPEHPQLLALLRIYFYHAPPAKSVVTNPLDGKATNLGQTSAHASRIRFQDELESKPDVALRMGELALRGWRMRGQTREMARRPRPLHPRDLEPSLHQKGVDLRIGLDIARLALRQLVDTLVVVTGDSDLVPAFKFARREGIRVCLDHLGGPVKRDLKAHVDVVL